MSNNKTEKTMELQSLLRSGAFYDVLNEHKASLQAEVNAFVLKQDLVNAYGALRALKDTDKILLLMQNKLEALKK